MNISQKGINLIKEFEGCQLKAYRDPVGIWTIGFGHTAGVYEGQTITQEQAENILRSDLGIYENGVETAVKVVINQNQFDALVSFTYNLGVGALKTSDLLKKVNTNDFNGAANEFGRWVNAGGQVLQGLVRRREAERQLFILPVQQQEGGSEDMKKAKVNGVRANSIGTVKLLEDALLKVKPLGYAEATGQTVKTNDEYRVYSFENGFYLIGNDAWIAADACNFMPNPSMKFSGDSMIGKVVVSIYPELLPLYNDPTDPNAKVVGRINNQDKYKVVDEKYVGDRLYLNIGGWNAADYFNIMSQN